MSSTRVNGTASSYRQTSSSLPNIGSHETGILDVTERDIDSTVRDVKTTACEGTGVKNEVIIPRTIGFFGGTSFIVGAIIGSGIFISPRGVAIGSGSVGFCILNWFLYGIVSILGGLCYAELGIVVRESGADYSILQAAFGSLASFMFSWVMVIIISPAGLATVVLTCAQYLATLLFNDDCGPAPDIVVQLLALGILLLLLAINASGTVLVTRIQVAFTAAKLIAMAVIIVGGIFRLSQGSTQHLSTGFDGTQKDIGKIVVGFFSGMWAYGGWDNGNYFTEDIKKPERNLPLSIIAGLLLVIIVYILVNVSYFTVMSIDELVSTPAVAATWASRVIPAFSWIMPLFIACSTFGCSNGGLFTTGRLMMVAARYGHLPEVFGMVHADRCTPIPSYLLAVSLAIFFIFANDVKTLMDVIGFSRWIFFALCMIALIKFRYMSKYKKAPRPFHLPLVIPFIVLAVSIFVVVMSIALDHSIKFFLATSAICVGFLFYIPFVYFKIHFSFCQRITIAAQVALQVIKPRNILD